MNIPSLTHSQLAVLLILADRKQLGEELLTNIKMSGFRKIPCRSGPAFYQFMFRLERDRLVTKVYTKVQMKRNMRRKARYGISMKGRSALQEALRFYQASLVRSRQTWARSSRYTFSVPEGLIILGQNIPVEKRNAIWQDIAKIEMISGARRQSSDEITLETKVGDGTDTWPEIFKLAEAIIQKHIGL